MKVLIIGAHPDDELLGCGGTIVKYLEQGHEVYVLICSQAYYSREDGWTEDYIKAQRKWQKDVSTYLGITKWFSLLHPTLHLNNVFHGGLSKDISNIVELVKPDVVFTHYDHDLNMDHVIVSKATQVACRPEPQKNGFKWKIKLLAYEVIGNTPNSFNPNYYEILKKKQFNRKMKAFSLYVIESKKPRHSRERIERLSMKRADEIMVNYAEAFMVIREVN